MKHFISLLQHSIYVVLLLLLLTLILPVPLNMRPYVVLSASMEPTLRTGSLAYIDSQTEIEKGDIITYLLQDGSAVTHRIVRIENQNFITKGDANKSEDISPVTKNMVIGKYIFSIPYLGFFYHIMYAYRWSLLCLVAVIISLYKLIKIEKEKFN